MSEKGGPSEPFSRPTLPRPSNARHLEMPPVSMRRYPPCFPWLVIDPTWPTLRFCVPWCLEKDLQLAVDVLLTARPKEGQRWGPCRAWDSACAFQRQAGLSMAQATGVTPAAGRSEKGTWNHPVHPWTTPNARISSG